MFMKTLFSFLIILFLCGNSISAQVEKNAEIKDLNLHLKENDSLFYAILEQEKISSTILEKIEKNKAKYIPPILFVLAEKLYSSGEKEKAVRLYYIALLRALIDAKQEEALLERNQKIVELYAQHFGRSIEEYAKLNFEKIEKQLRHACEYVKNTPAEYSFKWIYLDGAEKETDISQLKEIQIDSEKQEKLTFEVVHKIEEKLKKLNSY